MILAVSATRRPRAQLSATSAGDRVQTCLDADCTAFEATGMLLRCVIATRVHCEMSSAAKSLAVFVFGLSPKFAVQATLPCLPLLLASVDAGCSNPAKPVICSLALRRPTPFGRISGPVRRRALVRQSLRCHKTLCHRALPKYGFSKSNPAVVCVADSNAAKNSKRCRGHD